MFSSYKTSKGKYKEIRQKKFFCNADVDVNADTDAEMPMPRFPSGFNNNLNDEEMITSHLLCVMKQLFYDKNKTTEKL